MPIFSVIVPCYNHGEFLADCLNSVLFQSLTNWECIIINDGSTDHSETVALDYIQKDNRFKYFYQKNSGLAATRNLGIKNSSGAFILPLDSDDMIGKDYLLKAYNVFINVPETKLVYCTAYLFGDQNKVWELPAYNYHDFLINNCIFCSAIFKREDFDKSIGYDTNMIFGYEDWEFWIQILSEKDRVYKIEQVLFYYRKHKKSMLSFDKDFEKVNQMKDYIKKKHALKYINLNA